MMEGLVSLPCLACRNEKFDVLMTPSDVEADREWLQAFHLARTRCDDASLKDLADFTQANSPFIVACTNCGTVMRNPQPTPELLRSLYRSDTYGKETLDVLLEAERAFFHGKAQGFARDLQAGSKVLEVGSFVGAFLLAAGEMGWDATGVDVGKETCAFAEGMGLKVVEGELGAVRDGDYDAVFIWNTFDQTNQPGELLGQARELLRPGGLLVLRVPNGAFASAALDLRKEKRHHERTMLAQAWNNFLTFPYLMGYTVDALTQLVEQHDFRVVRSVGDTILPLSTAETHVWAVREEQTTKRAVMKFCRCRQLAGDGFYYPWMDVVAETI